MLQVHVCKDCEERQVGCHAHCERYLREKAKHEEIKHKMKLENELHRYATDKTFKRLDTEAMKRKKQHGYSKL